MPYTKRTTNDLNELEAQLTAIEISGVQDIDPDTAEALFTAIGDRFHFLGPVHRRATIQRRRLNRHLRAVHAMADYGE